jgi:hypothetical protein
MFFAILQPAWAEAGTLKEDRPTGNVHENDIAME